MSIKIGIWNIISIVAACIITYVFGLYFENRQIIIAQTEAKERDKVIQELSSHVNSTYSLVEKQLDIIKQLRTQGAEYQAEISSLNNIALKQLEELNSRIESRDYPDINELSESLDDIRNSLKTDMPPAPKPPDIDPPRADDPSGLYDHFDRLIAQSKLSEAEEVLTEMMAKYPSLIMTPEYHRKRAELLRAKNQDLAAYKAEQQAKALEGRE